MSNKKFGYARVSTAEQNEDRQVLELLEYGIEERDIYVDKQSGRNFERTNYMSLRNSILRNGDILALKALIALAAITLESVPSGNILPKRLAWTSSFWTRPFWIRPDTKICSVV